MDYGFRASDFIVDSHVHLWPASEMKSLSIYSPEGPFNHQSSVYDYKKAIGSEETLRGFIFVEADRKYDPEASDNSTTCWQYPLQELSFLRRIALGAPRHGEGHTSNDGKLCLGFVAWAPMNHGPEVIQKYLDLAMEFTGEAWPVVKGFRYLLQDKPDGTMQKDAFIQSLKLLGQRHYTFDIAADHLRRGDRQLGEVLDMVQQAHSEVPEEERVTFIVDHLLKPDLSYDASSLSFYNWKNAMYALGSVPQVYIKLSGGLTQMSEIDRVRNAQLIAKSLMPFFEVVVAAFGPSRILFGSDWPICTLGIENASWQKWRDTVDLLCTSCGLNVEDRQMIFGGSARNAYGI